MRDKRPSICQILCVSFMLLSVVDAKSQQLTAIKAARLLDVKNGRILENATVVIEGKLIKAVGQGDIQVDAEVIKLGDMTLLPGLIDVHTHLTLDIEGDWINQPVKETPADWALRGARNARRTLYAGFTTVRDMGALGFSDIALMRGINQGMVEGPRMIPSAHGLSITGGHGDITGFAPGIAECGPKEGVADGVDEVIKAVRYQIKHGAKVIKVCATAGVLSFEETVGAQQYSEEELRAIVEEASRHGLKVAAHAHGTEGIIAATRAGVASIEHGSILTEEAASLMKQKGTYLVPQLYINEVLDLSTLPPKIRAKEEFLRPLVEGSFRLALRAKVKIAFGTDAAVFPHGDNAREFSAQVRLGMKPIETIRGATVYATDLLGVNDRGIIAPGLLADIIAVPGNPLEDIKVLQDVKFVMKGGQVYKQP